MQEFASVGDYCASCRPNELRRLLFRYKTSSPAQLQKQVSTLFALSAADSKKSEDDASISHMGTKQM